VDVVALTGRSLRGSFEGDHSYLWSFIFWQLCPLRNALFATMDELME